MKVAPLVDTVARDERPAAPVPPATPSRRVPVAEPTAVVPPHLPPAGVTPPAAATVSPGTPAAAAGQGGDETPPVYATRLPPSTRLAYRVRRGDLSGTAQLDWSWSEGRYQLSLQGLAPAAPQAAWVSRGQVDIAGVAPERYTQNRRGREIRAANFQREAGRISFSGPGAEYALVEGSQDRLSWMIQLGAVLSANPDLGQPDAQIRIFVVGARGDAETWVFTVQGHEDLDLPGGPVHAAVHLLREPRRPYDTQAHVWLDPARHHLPVRLHLRVPATGEGTLLELQSPL